jgi:hypothetical protein
MVELYFKCTTKNKLLCTLHNQLYLCGQNNNAAESLASICNNSGNNEPSDVPAVGNVGGDYAINNNSRDVAFVNNVGDTENVGGGHAINNNHCDVAVVNNVGNTEFINDSCGTGPDINAGDQMGMVTLLQP